MQPVYSTVSSTGAEQKPRYTLFCTFVRTENLSYILEEITRSYQIVYDKIFVFSSSGLTDEYICTYNVEKGNIAVRLPDTIEVHRNKNTDTMYTIDGLNALNRLVNGRWVQNFTVPWTDYRKSLLLEVAGELRVIATDIFKIVNTN